MGEQADLIADLGCLVEDDSYYSPVFCKYCGESELYWDEMPDGRNRLFNADGTLHWCIEYSGGDSGNKKANEEDFNIGWDDNE